ncbi:hypothetical protein BGZ83_007036 [Gryganskiella cystojenkinii]|nr:hypothetical protein BGZ83_007036 [Gryganskiella cystojenkinii]
MEVQTAPVNMVHTSSKVTPTLSSTASVIKTDPVKPSAPTAVDLQPVLKPIAAPTAPFTITPENDPNPSWAFFPPSASYSSQGSTITDAATGAAPTSPSSSSRSPRSSSPPTASSSNANNNGKSASSTPTTAAHSATPSTHHRILDHCFHLSIETRLKQAEAQYLASTQEQAVEQQIKDQKNKNQTQAQSPMSTSKQEDWRRRQRSLVDEAVVLGRKGSNVEAIVDGILKSHRSSGPLQSLPRHLKHRLHLCQLTSMVFGRFDVASSTNNSAGLNIYSAFHSRRHGHSRAAIKQRLTHSKQGLQLQSLLQQKIPSSLYCRRHHRKDCQRTCCTLAKLQQEQQQALELKKKLANSYYMNSVRKQEPQRVAGLVDAIPAFLKCSAMSYRDIAKSMEKDHEESSKKEQLAQDDEDKDKEEDKPKVRVLEGWYCLLLELMVQAVIESYLCDESTGLDTIIDVFSFGDDSECSDDVVLEEAGSPSSSNDTATGTTTMGVEGLQFQNLNSLGSTTMPLHQPQQQQRSNSPLHDVTTQDRQDDILFANTPEYDAFKKARDERLQEIMNFEGMSMEEHFATLATRYPLIVLERQMTHFIARCQKLLIDPTLSQNHVSLGLLIPPTTSAYADGSLSMPVSEDEDDEDEEMSVKLEEIKEEDEEEEMTTASKNKNDDDDNSSAARVVQVSKKHRHLNGQDSRQPKHGREAEKEVAGPDSKRAKV